jgi:hypothetical protein
MINQEKRSKLRIIPVTWRQACDFSNKVHRHHSEPRGCKFAVGVVDQNAVLHGVALCGRPISRVLDDGFTIEVNRTATDGFPNANSALYGACWRIASAMGYQRLVTYTQSGESGISLRAAGLRHVRSLNPRGSWAESSVKLRHIRNPIGNGGVERLLWEKTL